MRKSNIGFIFQSFNLVHELTVRDNVELPLLYHNFPASERRERVERVLDRSASRTAPNIARRNCRAANSSASRRPRPGRRAELILADEPTGNLDSAHGEEIMRMLRQLNQEGSTIVMVTHSPSHADFASRVVNMLDGKILQERRRAA